MALTGRLRREFKTIEAMIALFCKDHHLSGKALCGECEELRVYAEKRLGKCPFGQDKPTCVNCPVHCYQAAMRERARTVMRYAGPRMLLSHPYLAIMHLIDGRRPTPQLIRKKTLAKGESSPAA